MAAFTRETLLDAVKTVAAKVGTPLSRDTFFRESGVKDHVLRKLFPDGGWAEVVELAGLPRHPKWNAPLSDEDLLSEFHRVVRKIKAIPTGAKFAAESKIDPKTIRTRFGGRPGLLANYRAWLAKREPRSPFLSLLPDSGGEVVKVEEPEPDRPTVKNAAQEPVRSPMNDIEIDTSGRASLWTPCAVCKARTRKILVVSITKKYWDPTTNGEVCEYWQILRCGGCYEPSFRRNLTNSTEHDFDAETGQPCLADHEELYPSPSTKPMRFEADLELLPERIRTIYTETHKALGAGLRVLACIGIRALVEAVCNARQAKGGDLKAKIDDLVAKQLLTPVEAKLMHGTRFLGNQAAHQVEPGSDETLAAAMEVAEHLLVVVYRLPKIGKKLPKGSKPKKATSPPPP